MVDRMRTMTRTPRDLVVACALIALALALYAPSLRNGFVWDDTALAADAEHLRRFGWLEPLWNNRWHAVDTERFYRPMIFWSHRVDLALWGEAPAGHHATNVLAFGALVLVLVMLLRQLDAPPSSWAIAALLFVAHPCHVEVVAWVAGRPDLFASLGVLLFAVGVFRGWPLPVTFVLMLGALLAKEVAVVVPLAMLGARLARGGSPAWDRASPSAVLAPFALALGVYLAARLACPGLVRGYPYGPPRSASELAMVSAINAKLAGRYLAGLATGREFGPLAFSEMVTIRKGRASLANELDLELALALVALCGLGIPALRAARRDRTSAFALLLGAGAVVLSMNLTSPRHQIAFGDRYLFLPSLAAAVALARVRTWPRPALALALVVAAGWSAAVVTRSARYASPLAFWSEAVALNPLSVHAHHMRAVALAEAGRTAEARAECDAALALDPLPERAALKSRLR